MIEDELVRRIAALELQLDNLVKPERGLQLTLADKDSDGDMDPLTSASWDGDSFSTGTGTIDWNADFGVPDNAKAVFIRLVCGDSGSAAAGAFVGMRLRAKSTTTNWSMRLNIRGVTNDVNYTRHGITPIASDGTSYYSVTATGASTLDIWIFVVGWFI